MSNENEFCSANGDSYPKWTTWDALVWKLWPGRWGGGVPRLDQYKDSWIVYNKNRIIQAANAHAIAPTLLASVARAEVGGKPDEYKRPAFLVRSYDWSGPTWVDDHLTITNRPEATSFGAVSIQLRATAHTLNLDIDRLSFAQRSRMITCLETDVYNLDIVAKYLHELILYDYPGAETTNLSEEQFIVVGSRYNRGQARALASIVASISATPGTKEREYSSYGRAMVRHRDHVKTLLGL